MVRTADAAVRRTSAHAEVAVHVPVRHGLPDGIDIRGSQIMEKTIQAPPKRKFVTQNTQTGEDLAVMVMTNPELETARLELKRQYTTAQEDFVEAMNRQLTLARFIAAIEFEQERRTAGH